MQQLTRSELGVFADVAAIDMFVTTDVLQRLLESSDFRALAGELTIVVASKSDAVGKKVSAQRERWLRRVFRPAVRQRRKRERMMTQ